MNEKAVVVVQARYNSSRLKGKVLWPLCGQPMLVFLLRRLKAGLPADRYEIVLATSCSALDDAVAAWGAYENVRVVRGSEDDLLSRYVEVLDTCPTHTVVRVTADNPLTSPEIIQWLVDLKYRHAAQYVQSQQLPVGLGADVFAADVLRLLAEQVTEPDEREHINLHILRHRRKFRTVFPRPDAELAQPQLRLTVDTFEDWRNVQSLFRQTDNPPWTLTARQAVARMAAVCV